MTLHHCRQVASLLPRARGSSWRQAAKRLRLIPDPETHIDLHNPSHISYVFNGAYSPVIPKVMVAGWMVGLKDTANIF